MTKHARVVLQDCRHAIAKHTDDLQAEDFRISWISIVTLLRAVGHVLKNVDGQQSPAMKRAIDKKWSELEQSKPEPYIFWEFILKGRNQFLKMYEHGIVREITIPIESDLYVSIDLANGSGKLSSPNAEIKSYILRGQFEGFSEQEVARMAYDWWKKYLDDVDLLAQQYQEDKQ